jgi:hypothetical protein
LISREKDRSGRRYRLTEFISTAEAYELESKFNNFLFLMSFFIKLLHQKTLFLKKIKIERHLQIKIPGDAVSKKIGNAPSVRLVGWDGPAYPLTLRLVSHAPRASRAPPTPRASHPTHTSRVCAALALHRLRLVLRTTKVRPPCHGIELRASVKLCVSQRLLGDSK